MDEWTSKKLPERLLFSKKRLQKRVIFSYILDYVIIVVLCVIFYIVDKTEPFHQLFSLENYTLHYPYAVQERVSVLWLFILCIFAPAVIIGIYTMVIDGLFSHKTAMPTSRGVKRLTGRYRFKDRLWELNCGILGLGLSVCAAFTITGALKNAIGKPRPDLIARCEIDPAVRDTFTSDAFRHKLTLSSVAICQQKNNYILQDGFKSFPSGHSSSAFAGLFYLSLYLAGKMHILDSKGEVWKSVIVTIPTIGAALVAGSRIMDARHHPFDVLSGSALGILVAWGSYRQYFPAVTETWHKGRAHPIRAWGREPVAPSNPTIRIDDDTRPLQPMRRPMDEEQQQSSGFPSETALARNDAPGGNIFRQQISQSQRRRDGSGQFGAQHSDTTGSTMSAKVNRYQNQMPGSNPLNGHSTSTRGHRQDNYDYSSSEDDGDYELQPTHSLSAPQSGGVYNPVQGTYTNTGYHPPHGVSPSPTPPPPSPGLATGDIGETRREAAPAVPPHMAGTTPQQT